MATDIASLVLAVDSTQVDKGSASLDKLAQAGSGASTSAKTLATAGAAVAVAAAAAGVAFLNLARNSINAADAMNDLHLKTGLAFKDLAAYELMAKQGGASTEIMAQGFKFLSKSMVENREELDALGVTSRDESEAMGQLADVIASINDPALKVSLAMKYLSRSGTEMIPMLSGGSAAFEKARRETEGYGKALEKSAPLADAFNDELAKFSTKVSEVGQGLAVKLLPLLTELATNLTDSTEDVGILDGAFDILVGTFRAVTIIGGNVAFTFKAMGTEIGGIAAQLAALARADFSGFSAIGQAMKDDAAKARIEFDAWEKRILGVGTAATTAAPGVKKLTEAEEEAIRTAEERAKAAKRAADERTAAAKRAADAYAQSVKAADSFLTSLKKEADTFGMSDAAKKMYDATTVSLTLHKGGERTAFLASAEAYIKSLEAATKDAKAKEEAADKEEKARIKIEEGIESLREQTEAINDNAIAMLLTGDQLREHIVLRAMEKSGLEANTQAYVEMKEKLNQALMNEEVAKKTKETMDKATEFTKQAAQNMQDAFADFFFDIMQGKFNNMADSFKRTIDRMVANAMAANLAQYLMGDFGKTGEFGGLIGSVVSGLLNDTQAPAPVVNLDRPAKFAVGTDFVPQTGLAIVHQGEKITPAYENRKEPARPPMSVTMNFTVPAPTDKRTQARIASIAGMAIQRAMQRDR